MRCSWLAKRGGNARVELCDLCLGLSCLVLFASHYCTISYGFILESFSTSPEVLRQLTKVEF